MLKPLSLSLGLSFALCAGSLALAGHHGGAVASEQCASEQCATPSPQGYAPTCAPKAKKHCLAGLCAKFKPKPKCYSYTWVLKKKRCGGGMMGGHCGHSAPTPSCETCGVYGSEQYPTSQGGEALGSGQYAPTSYGSGQTHGAGQTYGAGQAYNSAQPAGQAYGSGPAYGAGQATGAPAMMSAPASAPAPAGDEAPPAPSAPAVREEAPAPPNPSTPPAPPADAPKVSSNNSLLFLAPSGN